MADEMKISFEDGRGKVVTRTINLTLDIRDFEGRPGYVWLFLAANCHLSYSEIRMFLGLQKWDGLGRSTSWLQRRRWLFQDQNEVKQRGAKPNGDGLDARAIEIIRDNPTMSARNLSRLLKDAGIIRGKDWVQKNRVR